jgi:tetratricopeptide (TPR) repeat protein
VDQSFSSIPGSNGRAFGVPENNPRQIRRFVVLFPQMGEANKQIFLSYASQDSAVAARLADALHAAGIYVWFDQSELRGGDAWDQNIRQQIKACALFVPIVSANTVARSEGYFRLEWKLAVDRSHLMAPGKAFILPVVIDSTLGSDAAIPEKFREIQWTRLPVGESPDRFIARVRQILESPLQTTPLASPEVTRASTPRRWPIVIAAVVALAGIAVVGVQYQITHRAIVPYSAADRRMAFAVLPFLAPAGDARGVEIAGANTEAVTAAFERNPRWAHTASREAVRESVSRHHRLQDAAEELHVNFLIRGTVSKSSSGYDVNLNVIDGATERVVGSQLLTITGDTNTPRFRDDVDDAVSMLLYPALEDEVKRVADKPVSELDVRDLTFRGYVYWNEHRGETAKDGYETAMKLLNRALSQSPDDLLALQLVADINLCDCIQAWTQDIDKESTIGAAAIDRLLKLDPGTPRLHSRAKISLLRGRYEEVLILAGNMLTKNPDDLEGLGFKVTALIHLGRAGEALPALDLMAARNTGNAPWITGLDAAVRYVLADYAAASRLAQDSVLHMSEEELSNSAQGPVRLTLVASEARLGHLERAKIAMADFIKAVPQATTISAIRKWIYPTADLYEVESLFDGLRLAGIKE